MSTNTTPAIPEDIDRTQVAYLVLPLDFLTLEKNVRTNPVYAHLVPSIEANGIRTPLLGYWNDESGVTITDGQRRMLAAREAGLSEVPVLVRPHVSDDEAARNADRLIEQLITTKHRDDLTEVEYMRGVQELFDSKVFKHAEVTKRIGLSNKEATTIKKLGKSQAAMAAIEDRQLSMADALIVAQFQGNETALEKLSNARPDQLQHVAARIKRDEKEAAEYAEVAAPYAAKGFTILPRNFYSPNEPEYVWSEKLINAEGEAVDAEAISAHSEHWAVRLTRREAYVHMQGGHIVPTDEVDEEADDDEPAAEGYVHVKLVKWQEVWCPVYYTKEAETLGLTARSGQPAQTDAQDADAKARETEERRKTVELNKHGLAAQDVRREWVAALLSRRTAPKGSVVFIGAQLAQHRDLLNRNKAAHTAATLFGQTDAVAITNQATALDDTGDSRATMLLLGQVLGALEALTPKSAWAAKPGTWSYQPYSRDYLTFLAAQGYSLSDIERVITGEQDQDALYATIAAEKAAEREAAKASKKAAKASHTNQVTTEQGTAEADLSPEDIEAQEAPEADAQAEASVA
ncbi:hypothetical protein NJBCHELONAE_43810 [Mycobacteroides chelonae]|uniref:ParB/RepB/Spo0J family partition protein n=1 Tax=Mycobacteroides chelonae TaxID=1774 RepID=UPI0021DC371E|nr:ParB N-terminal domain-containing protein [Mycobacteroides chelonae]GLE59070.1 hypothetical protein NJBCHELONAE_43810 [Mycobacteroides chelonae]